MAKDESMFTQYTPPTA